MTRHAKPSVSEGDALYADLATWIGVARARERKDATISVRWLERLERVLGELLGKTREGHDASGDD